MSPQQQFTFIDFSAGKKTNTKTIKRHVSYQTNRRKRHEAIHQYQKSLLEAAERSPTSTEKSDISSPDQWDEKSWNTTCSLRSRSQSSELYTPPCPDGEFDPDQQLRAIQSDQVEDFWPLYVKWASSHLKKQPSSSSSTSTATTTTTIAQPPKKVWRVTCSPDQSRIFVSASTQHVYVNIPHIDDPTDQFRLERALKLCSGFIRGSYDSIWMREWQDRGWWEASLLPLGVWRESFPLAVEFIQVGKMQEAFLILNAALNVTAALLKEGHPGLLASLLGSMLYTSLIADHKLASLIRSHITQLSIVHLGPEHPISVLLTEQMRESDLTEGRTDFITLAVLDFFSNIFGPNHHVPLSFRFGYARRQLSNGQFDAATKGIQMLEDAWTTNAMPAAQLPKLIAFEKAKIISARQKAENIGSNKIIPNNNDLGHVADKMIEIPNFVEGYGPTLQPTDSVLLRQLGKRLLFGSHYALALYIFSHIKEVFSPLPETASSASANRDPNRLPVIVSRILVDHLKNTMKNQPAEESNKSNQTK